MIEKGIPQEIIQAVSHKCEDREENIAHSSSFSFRWGVGSISFRSWYFPATISTE